MSRFVHEVHMRWSDMDAYRHINNTAYLAYLEQARVAMFFHRNEGFSSGTVISRHEIDYLRPVVYHPEPLRLELWVDTIRGASFIVHYEVFDAGRVAARASTTCVTIDFDADRPRRLTGEEREILRGFGDDGVNRDWFAELTPVLRRVAALDAKALVRLLVSDGSATVLAQLPFGVLVSRTVHTGAAREVSIDSAVGAVEALSWLDGDTDTAPTPRDAQWRTARPPAGGWQRIETVPDDVVRGLVRSGALAVKHLGTQPGADALLDSVVLTVEHEGRTAEVTLRALSALTRMGFLPRGGDTHVDLAGRWIRVVARFGTVYLERAGGLVLR